MLLQCFGKKVERAFDRDSNVISTFSLNELYSEDFGLHDLDLLETIGMVNLQFYLYKFIIVLLGIGRFSRVRLCRYIMQNKFMAVKIMRKGTVVSLQQVSYDCIYCGIVLTTFFLD